MLAAGPKDDRSSFSSFEGAMKTSDSLRRIFGVCFLCIFLSLTHAVRVNYDPSDPDTAPEFNDDHIQDGFDVLTIKAKLAFERKLKETALTFGGRKATGRLLQRNVTEGEVW